MRGLGLDVLILGGASGVGAGLAEALHARGDKVLVADRVSVPDNRWETVSVDLLDDAGMDRLRERLERDFSAVDWLVCSAGGIDGMPLLDVEPERWRWMLDANLVAVAASVIRLADSIRPGGKLVITGSGSGFVAPENGSGLGAYCVAKHALLGYYRAVRQELRQRGVETVLMLPSGVKGGLAQNSARQRHADKLEQAEQVRGAQPQDRALVAARDAAEIMIAQILEGRAVVSNELEKMRALLRAGFEDLDAAFDAIHEA